MVSNPKGNDTMIPIPVSAARGKGKGKCARESAWLLARRDGFEGRVPANGTVRGRFTLACGAETCEANE